MANTAVLPPDAPACIALVVAAGLGTFLGGPIPKQYRHLDGAPLLRRSLATLARHARIDAVRVVCNPDDRELYSAAADGLGLLDPVAGGAARQDSVRAGLESLAGYSPAAVQIPRAPLYAGILIFATVGVYGMRQSAFDLYLMLAFGLVGVVMRRFDFPTAPVIVGMILGPLAEAQMRNALSIGEGSWLVFVQRPMSALLLSIVVAVLVLPPLLRWRARLKKR